MRTTLPETARLSPAARAVRAAGVVLVWAIAATPALTGTARCTFAVIFRCPCPGCGTTRALRLVSHGDLAASLHMQPLALPVVAVNVAFALATVWLTWRSGSPLGIWRWRPGRATIFAAIAVYALTIVLWFARFAGAFGGPVPVN